MQKALFLDRDGIVNVDKGYVYKWDDIEWIEEIFSIIQLGMNRGYKIIVLTNQSGIHYNKYSREDVEILHKKMNTYLNKKNLIIDEWIYCADIDSESRKPRPGMLLEAKDKFNIDLENSFMIGDKITDVFETDGLFTRPITFLIKGQYDLSKVQVGSRVKIFMKHQDIVKELEKVL